MAEVRSRSEGEASESSPGVVETVARNLARFEEAAQGRERSFDFEVLGRVARLRLAGEALEGVLIDALRHRQLPDQPAEPELEICAWERRSTGTDADLRGIPVLGENLQGGELVNDPRTLVHGSTGFLAIQGEVPWAAQGFDAAGHTAFLWARDPTVLSVWGEQTKPFLEIFHAWLIDSPWQPIHGGAVGGVEGGVLLAGGSGVGKSTTVLSCVRAGWLYAGDDYLAIRTDRGEAYVENLYGSARLCVDMADRFAEFRSAEIGAVSMNGIEKRDLILAEVLPRSRFGGFPVRAILLPRISGGPRSSLRPASPGQATVAIGAMTMHLLRAGAQEAFEKIAGIAAATPAYWLDLGDDIDDLPELIGSQIGVGPA
jgi:hypothetical protein